MNLLNNWWILVLPKNNPADLLNATLVTNRLIPGDIDDDKKPNFGEFPIAGLDYVPVYGLRNDSTRLSMTIPFVNKDLVGNTFDLYAVEKTRRAPLTALSIDFTRETQWQDNPVCIYSGWGTHRPPLPIIVEQAKMKHLTHHTKFGGTPGLPGAPTFTEVNFVFRYLENNILWRAWKKLGDVGALVSSVQNAARQGFPF